MSNNNKNGNYKKGKRPYREIMKDLKGQLKPAGKDLFVDMIAGLAGAMTGAVIGRSSLIWGAVVNYAGHVFETQAASTFGTGMAVVNIISGDPVIALSGDAEPTKWEKAKARLTAFKNGLSHQLYFDKFSKKDDAAKTEEKPVGELKHFVYPNKDNTELDWSAADEIENQLVNSAKAFQEKQEMKSTESVSGTEAYARAEFSDPLY